VWALSAGVLFCAGALAQPTGDSPLVEPQNGPRVVDPGRHLIIGGTVHVSPTEVIPAEQIPVIRIEGGRVTAIIADSRAASIDPAGFRVWTLDEDDHVYAGFIEPWFEVSGVGIDAARPGHHWNGHVTPDHDVLSGSGLAGDDAKALRSLGFVAAALAPDGGIFRGFGAVVSTGAAPANPASDPPTVYLARAFHAMDFVSSGFGDDITYPTSQMGGVALIRQVWHDFRWQTGARAATGPIAPNALDALALSPTVVFETDDELEIFQADAIAQEFGHGLVVVGSGTEVRRLDGIASLGRPLILPLRYPRTPDVSSIGKAEAVELETLMLWEQAPTTAGRLAGLGVETALTSSKSLNRDEFHANLIRAIEHGLSPTDALAMLTTVPARILGVEDRLGTIAVDRPANLVISSEPLFDPAEADEAEIRDVWVEGERYEINADDDHPFEGAWTFRVGPDAEPFFEMILEIDDEAITATETTGEDGAEPESSKARGVELSETTISFMLDDTDENGATATYIQTGVLTTGANGGRRIVGTGIDPRGGAFAWHAVPREMPEDDAEDEPAEDEDERTPPEYARELPGYPFGPYAERAEAAQRSVALTNATVWTSGPAGIIQNGYVLVENGRVSAVGPMPDGELRVPEGVDVVNLNGAHVTPGLIDAHSHTGTWRFGTNEAGQAVTSEVRMADTSDPDHVNWYRQLAAGVTTVNTLHGSANPIGGQAVIQKVRWGVPTPRGMHMDGAKPGIKFALGENVVQVNWGERFTTRYPKTRMGVEALLRDRFTAARAYAQSWRGYFASTGADPARVEMSAALARSMEKAAGDTAAGAGAVTSAPRRDLELDPLVEILAGDRLVHCHSYRQDEILMLANLARDFGFTIGSYQHGLETYKVAEAVKARSLGGSLFSDWWAYKVEVQDAIPHAGPILWETGVRVSFNSDSDELARRMNTEAAKMIRYGREIGLEIPPEDALAVVTINPAVQLGIADRVGSIEVGKDADLAVWTGDPLSGFSRCLRTFVDGREYYSDERDAAHRERIAAERARLIARIVADPDIDKDKDKDAEAGDEPESETAEPERRVSLAQRIRLDALRAHHRALWLEGRDPSTTMRPGDCGCGLAHMGVIR
jgi:N-acetylglucosamine-6-phosphate deacetylase